MDFEPPPVQADAGPPAHLPGQRSPADIAVSLLPRHPRGSPFRAGHPDPAMSWIQVPAAVMIHGPSEALLGGPGPPVIGEDPAPILIRPPSVGNVIGHPSPSCPGNMDPCAVGSQIVVKGLILGARWFHGWSGRLNVDSLARAGH